MYADACTTVADRVSYARVLIEMDITRPLPLGLYKRKSSYMILKVM